MRKIFLVFLLLLTLTTIIEASYREKGSVIVIIVEREIDVGAVRLITHGIERGEEKEANLVIIKLNTFGGYLKSLDEIVNAIINSKLKTIAWIPPGGKAVSAGAFIALACDSVYMGEGGVIGAAEPRPKDTKILKFSAAWIRSLASSKWGTNDPRVEIAEKFVTENKALSAVEAFNLELIDGLVNDLDELLRREGLSNAEITYIKEGVLEEILSLLGNPFVISLLTLIGMIMLLAELAAAGFQGLGIIGILLLIIGFYGAGLIGLDLLALSLIVAGGIFLAVEMVKAGLQGFGFIGVALVLVALLIYFRAQPYIELTINMVYLIPPLITFLALALYIAYQAARAVEIKVKRVEEELIGKIGLARTLIEENRKGVVYVMGEEWSAVSAKGRINSGTRIRVVGIKGLTLVVKPES